MPNRFARIATAIVILLLIGVVAQREHELALDASVGASVSSDAPYRCMRVSGSRRSCELRYAHQLDATTCAIGAQLIRPA